MKIDLNLKEIKILINWAEYKNADLPFNIDENTLKAKLYEATERKNNG